VAWAGSPAPAPAAAVCYERRNLPHFVTGAAEKPESIRDDAHYRALILELATEFQNSEVLVRASGEAPPPALSVDEARAQVEAADTEVAAIGMDVGGRVAEKVQAWVDSRGIQLSPGELMPIIFEDVFSQLGALQLVRDARAIFAGPTPP
jgi:hypothetical protein